MPTPMSILQHTPWPVFALFAFLVALGVQALRPRTVSAWRLLAVPLAFIAWGVVSLLSRATTAPWLAADWLASGIAGAAIGAATFQTLTIDRSARRIQVPGSVFPLLRNVAIFAAKYGLAVAMAIVPEQQSSLTLWDIGISGLSAGYFIGWLVLFAFQYRQASESPQANNGAGLFSAGTGRFE